MQLTLNASKYTTPQLPAVIVRDRLIRRLHACRSTGLILLIGQAAQGKTTFTADYLQRYPAPVAWLCLDAGDAEASNFCALLIQALIHALPSENFNEYLEAGHMEMGPLNEIARFSRCLQFLLARLPGNMQIVLDGLDRLPDQAPAFKLIQQICGEVAVKGRVWLLSRRKLQFNYQQALVSRRMLVLNNEDLAFTRREIRIYFESLHQLNLPDECIDQVLQITEGWPGGLVLLAQTLERINPAQWVDYLSNNLPERLCGEALQYFSEEVFNAQPPKIRRFLTRASVPDVIDPVILADALDDPDCPQQLDRLVQHNAFIHSFYYGKRHLPLFRFNQLFQEFLRTKFQATHTPAEQQDFYAQIAAAYDAQGDVATAIKWYLRAREFKRAAAGLTKISTDWVIRGCLNDLTALIEEFPEQELRSDPWLFFLLTLTRRIKGGTRNLNDFEEVLARFAARDDLRGQMLALSYLIEANVLLGQPPATCLRWIQEGERWLASQSDKPYYAYAKSLLWLQIGYGYIAGGLDLTKGLSACQNAFLLARKMEDKRLMARSAVVSVLGLATAGEFERADDMLAKIEPPVTTGVHTDYDILRQMVDLKLCLRRGDLKAAEKRIKAVGQDIETYGLLFLYPAYVDATGFLQLYLGRYAEARLTCRHLLDVAILAGNPVYKGQAHRLSGLIHYFQANYPQASTEARQAIRILESCGPTTLHLMRAKQLLALACMHLKQFAESVSLLHEALEYYQSTANYISLAETYLILGLLAHMELQDSLARQYLHTGFEIAAERGFDQFVLLRPADYNQIRHLEGQFGTVPGSRPGNDSDHENRLLPNDAVRAPSEIKSVPSGAKPGIDIQTFGGFRVLRDGIESIKDNQWGGRRPKLLLKSIIVHGLREIPKDILIDDLWPDSSPHAGMQNFKVTLHRLRKILEPGLKKSQGSALVHLKNNLVSLNKEFCRVDLEEFLQACKDIKRHALNSETDQILILGQRVMTLYQGDFLPEEPYTPWVEMKRWALKDTYIDVVLQMAAIYHRQDQLQKAVACCRAVLRIDSCREEAGQLLMQLYARQGRRNEAMQVFSQLSQALKNELGVDPEPATTTILSRIQGQM